MDKQNGISIADGSAPWERDGPKRRLPLVTDPLGHADALDWWQEQRWASWDFCRQKEAELQEFVERRVAELPLTSLVMTTSSERAALESEILEKIHETEVHLANEMEHTLTGESSGPPVLTGYDGWTGVDLGKILLGGSGTALAVTAAARGVPGVLALIGLPAALAVAAPLAVTLGAGVILWSADTVADGKRQEYLTLLKSAVTRLLIARDNPQTSVLSRHHGRIDAVYQRLVEGVP